MKREYDSRARTSNMTRQIFFNVALMVGLGILGGLCGLGVRMWIGGLKVQRAQLERCILNSKHSHSKEDARSTLAQVCLTSLDAEGFGRAAQEIAAHLRTASPRLHEPQAG